MTTAFDPRYKRIAARDASADFYYSVRTTGVYCRPSCGARLARPENVEFYSSTAMAEAAGFRPCKRCKPNQPPLAEQYAEQAARACRYIEVAGDDVPGLHEIASHVGLSPYHFHRIFKAVTGLTPKKYASAHRARKLRAELAAGDSITTAIYAAGFNSNSRFYEASNGALGMRPSQFRAGGARAVIHFAIGQCQLGAILAARSEVGICAILLGDDPDVLVQELEDRFPQANLIAGDRKFEETFARIVGFVEQPGIGLDLPLDIRGTAFQQRVWQALLRVPLGETVSYADIAHRIGSPKSVRAVAQACAANSLAVAIPCHRVVRSDGNLSGYRWGVERKRALLEKEARA